MTPAGVQAGNGQIVTARERVGVVGTELGLANLEGRLMEWDRLQCSAGGKVNVPPKMVRVTSVWLWRGPITVSCISSVFSRSPTTSEKRPADTSALARLVRVRSVSGWLGQVGLVEFQRRLVQSDCLGEPASVLVRHGEVGSGNECVGWSGPSFASCRLSVRSCRAMASGNLPTFS